MNEYSDIIDHPHHQSQTRPHMSMTSRAAQFSPFAALTGYGDAVDETGRLTDEKITLDDDALQELDCKMQMIIEGESTVAITYFLPDLLKEGGSYTISSGRVKKIDRTENRIVMHDGTMIPLDDVFDIGFID